MNHNVNIGVLGLAGLLFAAPCWSFSFSACDGASKEPRPEWVNNADYVLPGFKVGVGAATRDGRSKDEQQLASESDAKRRLVEHIQVSLKSEVEQNTRMSGSALSKEASSKLTVSSEADLRGLKTKSQWLDKDTCIYYTLMVVSNESLAQSKREKLMKGRMDRFKGLLAAGVDEQNNRDIKQRRKYLEEAQVLLAEIDFTLLPDEPGSIHAKHLNEALAQVNKETAKAKGRMALFALNEDGSLNGDVLGRMLDQLRSGDTPTDRLMADCASQHECISIAKERGYTLLTLLATSSQVATSQMGSLKGTLSVTRTVYDIESRKAVRGPDKASAQVIGWGREELDWGAAAEKAVQSLK